MNIQSKGYWFAALLAAMFALSSCTKNDDANEENIVSSNYIVVASSTSMTANTPTAVITVTSNCHWRISVEKGSWSDLNISPLEGDNSSNVIVETSVNNTEGDRSAVLTFSNEDGTLTRTCTITQSAGDFQATLSLENLESMDVNYESLTRDINVLCNTSWSAEAPSADTWCTLMNNEGTNNGKFSIAISDNQSAASRTTSLKVVTKNRSGNQLTVTVPVTQAGAPVPEATVNATFDKDATTNEGIPVTITGKAYSRSKYNLTEFGYCISRSANPRIDSAEKTEKFTGSSSSLEGDINATVVLEDGYTYYICTYARSVVDIKYSEDYPLTLPGNAPGNDDNSSPSLTRKNNK